MFRVWWLRRITIGTVCLVAPVFLFGSVEPPGQPITATDLLRIRQVTGVEVSRNGSFAVYAVKSTHSEPPPDRKGDLSYSYQTHLWFINLTDPRAKPVQLTFGDRNDSNPAISPDGRMLAFVREDTLSKGKPKPQVWILPLHVPGEPQMIARFEYGAESPRWRPDSKALLVASPLPVSKIEGIPHFDLERPQRAWFDWDRPSKSDGKDTEAKIDARPDGDRRSIRNWLEQNSSRDNPTTITRLYFQDELTLQREMTISQLFLIDLENNNQVTQISNGFYSHRTFSFSPDGRQIVYLSTPQSSRHPDRIFHPIFGRNAVWLVNGDGSNAHTVLDNESIDFSEPRFSPDGRSLVLVAREADEPTFRQLKLAHADLDGKNFTWLTQGWDSNALKPHTTTDGQILFATPWQGAVLLKRTSINGEKIDSLTTGPVGVGTFDEGGGRIVLAMTSVRNPSELCVLEKNNSLHQLTDLNTSWVAKKTLSLPTEHWITRPDGTQVQYWIMNPTHTQPGKKYPFVLEMHGGPSAMWGPGEFTMWHEFQLLCSWGYGVVYCNPRGSSGYGYAFQKANYRNWGDKPAGDVLAALDDAMNKNPAIDPDRLFLTGGSYAGYLTAWMIGHDHRFKAAAAQRGVYDLTTAYGESNVFPVARIWLWWFAMEP
jgi:dipeptidyl aminopeptidase/acylaminoacyl peptidase